MNDSNPAPVGVEGSVRPGVRYLLCPGHVMSKTDGQYHYVSAHELAGLYGVRMDQCDVRPDKKISGFGWRPAPWIIELHPRYDGDYRLPSWPNARTQPPP